MGVGLELRAAVTLVYYGLHDGEIRCLATTKPRRNALGHARVGTDVGLTGGTVASVRRDGIRTRRSGAAMPPLPVHSCTECVPRIPAAGLPCLSCA